MMNASGHDEETSFQLLKVLEENPSLSQRELSSRLGVSLGKVNFCLKALVQKGHLKVNNFRNSQNKMAYAYLLTPYGVEEKTRLTMAFLKRKLQEYDRLREEIEELQTEIKSTVGDGSGLSRLHTPDGEE